MERPSRWIRVAGTIALIPLLFALAVFVAGNGVTRSAIALASLPVLVVAGCFVLPASAGARRRAARAIVIAIAAVDVGYIALRLARPLPSGEGLRYCEGNDCARRPPVLARLVDEDETAYAGLRFASLIGLIGGAQERALDAALHREYAVLLGSPRYAGLPNAVFVRGSRAPVRHLRWVPPGKTDVPCLVYLHGFGGQLSIYVEALIEGGLGEDFVIAAPFLNNEGDWWSVEGEATIRDLVEHGLPPAVDRRRVFLVGLSNGAIGAARLMQRESVRKLFRGAILVSGGDGPRGGDVAGAEMLMITGAEDPRFPVGWLKQAAWELSAKGAAVEMEVMRGDHIILLDRKREVTDHIRRWIGSRTR